VKTVLISETEFAAIADRDESHFFDIKQHDVSGSPFKRSAPHFPMLMAGS